MTEPVPVVFCFDRGYVNYSAVAMFSLLVHSRTALKVHCIMPRSAVEALEPINRVAGKFGTKIHELVIDDDAFDGWREIGHIKRASYYRLLVPELVPESKVIYLDSDIIVKGDLSGLYATEFEHGSLFAGVPDMVDGADTKIPRAPGDLYINAGVLVMNLDKLRQDDFLQKCRDIHNRYKELLVWADQCVINKYAEGRKLAVDKKWNRLVLPQRIKSGEWQTLVSDSDTRVIHFVNSTKPWSAWCNPRVAEFWWGYARLLDIPDLRPVGASTINQLLGLARVLDSDRNLEESGKVKNKIIKVLMDRLGKS